MKTIKPISGQIIAYGENELTAPEGFEFTGEFRYPVGGEPFLSALVDKIYQEGGIGPERLILKKID